MTWQVLRAAADERGARVPHGHGGPRCSAEAVGCRASPPAGGSEDTQHGGGRRDEALRHPQGPQVHAGCMEGGTGVGREWCGAMFNLETIYKLVIREFDGLAGCYVREFCESSMG